MAIDRSDSELVRAARAGDGGAFADLVRPEYRTAYRLAYGLLHDADEAEDAVQEASLKAWRKLGNLRDGSPLRPWFLGIVANECRSVRRSKRWSTRADGRMPDLEVAGPDVAASLDLQRSVSRLGHDDRLVLMLRYSLDLPFEEIAVALGVTPKAARSRVDRAIARLRPMLRLQEALT